MKNTGKIMKYFLYFFLLAIGIIIGIAIRHFHNIPIAETIDVVDLATLVVTVFLAVYIPEVLDRKLQTQRDKKELLEKRIDEFQSLLRKANTLVQDDDAMSLKNYLTVQNILDVSQHKFEIISRLLKSAKLKSSFDEDIEMINKLCDEHKKLLYSNEAKDKNFSYSNDIQQQEESLFNKIDEAASMLIFKISDAE